MVYSMVKTQAKNTQSIENGSMSKFKISCVVRWRQINVSGQYHLACLSLDKRIPTSKFFYCSKHVQIHRRNLCTHKNNMLPFFYRMHIFVENFTIEFQIEKALISCTTSIML